MDEAGVEDNTVENEAVASDGAVRDRVETDWPLRPWIFAGVLALAAFAIYVLTDNADDSGPRIAAAAFIAFAAGAFVFTAERGRTIAPAIFSIVTGLVVGGLTWRAIGQGNDVADGGYAVAAGVFACLLAVPLFQADFLRHRMRTDYKDIHYFVWTDAITGAGAFAFLGLAWLLLLLLSALFALVGIPLEDLIDEGWFGSTFSGLAIGAALGTLRNQLKIIGTLQSVVLLVLSILALPLALAIIVFLIAVALSGPGVLWDATDSATPVLLSIAIGAYVLANAVLRDADEDMVGGAALKWSGFALALGILPLTVFAAISTGVRIDQHGLSPERLWALAAVGVAVAFGLAYFVDALVGAGGPWRDRIRASNMRLGIATALFALFLALPILKFGSISTNDQLARLESGAISVEEFDFAALRWDFGEPGRMALSRLAKSDNEAIAKGARQAQLQESRPYRWEGAPDAAIDVALAWQGGDEGLRTAIEEYLMANGPVCEPESSCTAIAAGELENDAELVIISNGSFVQFFVQNADGTVTQHSAGSGRLRPRDVPEPASPKPEADPDDRTFEIRPYEGRQLYVDGEPLGEPFE